MLQRLALLCLTTGLLCAQTKLLRFPDIHADQVVFTYGGDLWKAPSTGGTALRLTAHPGLELFAKFSPDGKYIAFTGQYDGDEQVYVIPATGGTPKQLTFYPARGPLPDRWGYDNQVYGWTPDGKSILFRSLRDGWTLGQSRLYTVPLEGGLPTPLPMPLSGAGDLSPDQSKVIYSPLFRDFRTWKRYEGGWAQDLFIFDVQTSQIEPIANSPRTERDPMWIGNKIYFASDRTGTLNLYEYNPANKQAKALTSFTDWDVRWPSKGDNGEIVFELNGELQVLDTKSGGTPRKLSINVPSDGLASRPSTINVGDQIRSFSLSPKGERALFDARGDIYTAPIEKGIPRNLTHSSGAHDRNPQWSPDGRHIAFISDASGEDEIWLVPYDGSTAATPLTSGTKQRIDGLRWSPDSKSLAFSNKSGEILVLTLASKSITKIAQDKTGQAGDYVWAPDSRYLAFSLPDPNGTNSLHIWSAADQQLHRLTDDRFDEREPVWDPDGNYLYYLSTREYQPLISGVEFNFATTRDVGIFALALRKDVKNPFPLQDDQISLEADKKEPEKKADKAPGLSIDFDGLWQRVTRFPIPAGNYNNLQALAGHVLFTRSGNPYYGRPGESQPAMVIYSIKDRKETILADNVGGYDISADGKKLIVADGGQYFLYDANPGGKGGRKSIGTNSLTYDRNPHAEWMQIFNEVWRRYRDYFYVANMHGYHWEALRQKYASQVEYVGHRADLNYIIGEMIAELNIGHAYNTGGDWDLPPRPHVALPGARFELDPASARYKIAQILAGENEEANYRSPLTEVGVDARVGDFILAIDGLDLTANTNPYQLLRGKSAQPVRLTLNSKPTRDGARDVLIQPIESESDLLYLNWVAERRALTSKLSNGRVGYIHIPNMGAEGIREFIKQFYSQIRKEALIIDDRWNGGGNVSQMIIERLRRQLLATSFARNNQFTNTYPGVLHPGPKVCLLNENSASDGDIFPAMFRQAGLGPLIGKRSWGGVVGITTHGSLLDSGQVNVPEFGIASPDGKWIIEGHGVDPDIVVEDDPKSLLEHRDPQLERGVQEALKLLDIKTIALPSRPADPIKTK